MLYTIGEGQMESASKGLRHVTLLKDSPRPTSTYIHTASTTKTALPYQVSYPASPSQNVGAEGNARHNFFGQVRTSALNMYYLMLLVLVPPKCHELSRLSIRLAKDLARPQIQNHLHSLYTIFRNTRFA
jgi:hypothetical protein